MSASFKIYFPVLLLLIISGGCSKNADTVPNIVLILVDDLGWKDLGCYGSDFYQTPAIDRLAKEGMLFTDAYAACPVCSPSRASIMTGKYPSRLNITDWIPGDDPRNRMLLGTVDSNQLALSEITLAETLRNHGYKTFFAGKWHLGDKGYYPEDQGFEINIGGHHRGSPPGGYYVPYKNPKLPDGPEGEYLTDRLTNESIDFIKANKDNPFFVFLSFYTVHTPIQANNQYAGIYQNKLAAMENPEPLRSPEHHAYTTDNQVNAAYASMVHAMDVNIGRLMTCLEENGLKESTIIIFTSDNGGLSTIEYPDWTAPTSIRPLRAGKGWCYEGGIRVPLIISAPGFKAGFSGVPVIGMDLYPTVLELAGLPSMPEQHLDGLSLARVLAGNEASDREDIFWHYPHYHTSGWKPGAAIRSGDWKLVLFYEDNSVELYDLRNDLAEQHNLAGTNAQKAEELLSKLKKMQQQTGALMPLSNKATAIE